MITVGSLFSGAVDGMSIALPVADRLTRLRGI